MSEKAVKKGIKFVPASALTEEAKDKLDRMMARKKKSLEKLVSDYKSGSLIPQS